MQRVSAGIGRIHLQCHGHDSVFSELSYSYPLKLLSPRVTTPGVGVVYVLTYGGGLVGGDRVNLGVEVEEGARLVMLTQGSTKVFKSRLGQTRFARPQGITPAQGDTITSQSLDVTISPNGALFLLPDPVTCFRAARYNQKQIFRLASRTSSAVLLDWITSGRISLGEEWVFGRYWSLNEVWVDGKRVARDVMLLEEEKEPLQTSQADGDPSQTDSHPGSAASPAPSTSQSPLVPKRTLAERLTPYSCYATVLIYGPLTHETIRYLSSQFEATTLFKTNKRPDLIWGLTLICNGGGCILRVAARETEQVRHWLGAALHLLEGVVGVDIFRKTFS